MRPKKVIVVWAKDEIVLRLWVFRLGVWGYRVIGVHDEAEMVSAVLEHAVDLVIAMLPRREDWAALRCVQERRQVPILSIALAQNGAAQCSEVSLLYKQATALEVRDRVKILAMRKRGRKKEELPLEKGITPLTPVTGNSLKISHFSLDTLA